MRDDFDVVNRAPSLGAPPRPVHEIRCSRCPVVETIAAHDRRLPPHTVAMKFGKLGWRVIGIDKHVCPACAAAETLARKAPTSSLSEPAMAPKPSPAKPAQAHAPDAAPQERPAHASPAASGAIVDLYLVLADHYDGVGRRYESGWDDERVARETGLALGVVQERREKDFGPLVRDTTREDLTRALDLSAKDLRRAGDLLEEARALLTGAQARHDEITKLAARLAVPAAGKAA